MDQEPFYPNQAIPLSLTAVVFAIGVLLLLIVTCLLNLLPFIAESVFLTIHPADVLIGLTIYLKTSIDFAIFIGRLMQNYPGWRNRIAIEVGTALGNILGTLAILVVWDIFREVRPLMAGMIILASLVLLRLAEDGLEHAVRLPFSRKLEHALQIINRAVAPMLNRIIPHNTFDLSQKRDFKGLFLLSFTVPFILGSDDFAGYIPLFNIVNVIGFATGVFLGHMLLNIALFLSPKKTIIAVKNPYISFLGSLAFILLAIWGLREAFHLLL